jgi:hypothetical protein
MRRFLIAALWACMLAGCWQVASIDVIDLPVRDGQSDEAGLDQDAPDWEDQAEISEPQPDVEIDNVPPDLPEDPVVEDTPPDVPPTGMSAEQYCMGMAGAYCYYFQHCCSEEELYELQMLFDCDDDESGEYYQGCVDQYDPMVTAGRLVLEEADFSSCIAYLEEAGTECLGLTAFFQEVSWILETACAGVYTGGCCIEGRCASCRTAGEACSRNEECPIQRRCIEGTCRETSVEGGPCDDDDELSHSDCGYLYWCSDGTCRELQSPGEQCPDTSVLNYGCSGLCLDSNTCASFCGPT